MRVVAQTLHRQLPSQSFGHGLLSSSNTTRKGISLWKNCSRSATKGRVCVPQRNSSSRANLVTRTERQAVQQGEAVKGPGKAVKSGGQAGGRTAAPARSSSGPSGLSCPCLCPSWPCPCPSWPWSPNGLTVIRQGSACRVGGGRPTAAAHRRPLCRGPPANMGRCPDPERAAISRRH